MAWGTDDRAFRIELAERFCAEVPTATRARIEGSKILVCRDQPERLAEHIVAFVRR